MKIYISSTISVSQRDYLDCQEMAYRLSKAGYVHRLHQIFLHNRISEYGCRLTQSISSTEDLQKYGKN